MAVQLFFEDIKVGSEIPTLVKHPTTQQLVKWAGASEDFYPLHYDKDFTIRAGLSGVIVHGRLKASFLGQLLTNWIGNLGMVKKFSCSYRGMDYPDQDLYIKGKLTNKYVKNGENCVECQIWIENEKGEQTTIGNALVTLPSRINC